MPLNSRSSYGTKTTSISLGSIILLKKKKKEEMSTSISRQVGKKSRGPQGERDLEFSKRK